MTWKSKSNKPFPPKWLLLIVIFYYSNRKETAGYFSTSSSKSRIVWSSGGWCKEQVPSKASVVSGLFLAAPEALVHLTSNTPLSWGPISPEACFPLHLSLKFYDDCTLVLSDSRGCQF